MDFKEAARLLGKQGGLKTFNKYGNAYMKQLSRRGVEAREKKKSVAKDPIDNRPVDPV